MHGPEPPPGFVDRPPSPPPVCGPARPSTEEQQAAIAAVAAAADNVDLIGPLPAEQRLVDELRHARRPDADDGSHQRRRRRDAAGDDGGGGDRREEWMLVPPEALAPSLMSTASDGARKRARGATADKSWTRVGGAAATDSGSESSDSASSAAVERRRREAAEVEAGRLRDAEMEQLAAATAGSRGGGDASGSKSLLELHRDQLAQEAADQSEKALRRELKKLKKAKKKQKKKTKKSKKKRSRKSSTSSSSGDDPNARVPFNRDADLEIRGLDSKVKQSIVAKSQASMASRFSHGGQKFL